MGFWERINDQLEALKSAKSADEVIAILDNSGTVYDGAGSGDAFFAGSGGDGQVWESLAEAGWTTAWMQAAYYWQMTAPDRKSGIKYVEGDVYRVDMQAK